MLSRYKIIILVFLVIVFSLFFFVEKNNTTETEEEFTDIVFIDPEPEETIVNNPEIISGVYLSGWSAGNDKYLNYLISLIEETGINSVIIDVKDFSGHLSYKSEIESVLEFESWKPMIRDIEGLIERLKEKDIYLIARVTIFQDPVLAINKPEIAIKSKVKTSSGLTGVDSLWKDNLGLYWIDPLSVDAWDYNIEIIKEALGYGFDEVNIDYIRFPSDGVLSDMEFPFWDREGEKRLAIKSFYEYLRSELPEAIISADLFGLTTVSYGDLGIGQVIEDACPYFDYISPMIYPSHYASGFMGYNNPAEYPYEVVRNSSEQGLLRIKNHDCESKFRPWLQSFSLGAIYDEKTIQRQIDGLKDALGDDYAGYMLWNAKNIYNIKKGCEFGCYISGCSGEFCSDQEEVISTCEYLLGSECLSMGSSCEFLDNKCVWVLSKESADCFIEIENSNEEDIKESRIYYLFEKARNYEE
jgi:hypothetical protein